MLNRRKIRASHDMLVACQELGRYLYPYYPGTGVERFAAICEKANVQCEGEDLTLDAGLALFAFLQGEVDELFHEIAQLYERKVRSV